MSNKYQIENIDSGFIFGIYEADSEEGALDAFAKDAGYRDIEHANEVATVARLRVVEVD